jgi:solute:Na+ symporter, SSS family
MPLASISSIHSVDWMILGVGFGFFLAWAIYLNTKCRSVADYLVSGRKVRMWLGMGAGIGGEIGLISIAAMCEQGYRNGFSFVIGNLISTPIMLVLFGVYGFGIERFRATRCMSVPQYVEMRFTSNLRVLIGIINCIAGVLQMCIFPIGGAIFVRRLIGAPDTFMTLGMNIPTDWGLMFILLICPLIFTTLGGYTTLIVTNFFQGILVMATMTWLFVHVVIQSAPEAGSGFVQGVQAMWSGLEQNLKLAGVNPFANSPDAYGIQFFLFLNVMTILLQFSYGPYLQQYASMDKPRTVSRSFLLGAIFGFGRSLIIFGLGVAALAAMGKAMPDTVVGVTANEWASYATPYFLAQLGIPVILMGFLLLALLFADVAVTDKYILSWSTSIVNDCIQPFRKNPFGPKAHIRAVRLTVLAICVILFLFGLIYTPGMTIWSFMWLTANLIGGSGIVVLLGMYWRGAKTSGAYACVGICVIAPLADIAARQYLARSGQSLPWTPEQTGLYTYLAGAAAMILISLVSREKSKYWDLGIAVREQNEAAT